MLFHNKTNSSILANLQVPTKALNKMYMTRPGWGMDILEALHTIISPEELQARQKELGITDKQINRLFKWLATNCYMPDYRELVNNTEGLSLGYQFSMMSLVDNNHWGLLTKIRRQLVDWKPQIKPNGQLTYQEFKWLKSPELIFENEDSKLYVRNGEQIAGWSSYNKNLPSSYCYAKGYDEWYETQPVCFQKVIGNWQLASDEHTQGVLTALEVMEQLAV